MLTVPPKCAVMLRFASRGRLWLRVIKGGVLKVEMHEEDT